MVDNNRKGHRMSKPANTLIQIHKSIAATDAFRAQPASPTSWTQHESTTTYYAVYPAATEMEVARSPDRVFHSTYAEALERAGTLEDCVRLNRSWFYDSSDRRLYVNVGADPSSNITCRFLEKNVVWFMIVNRTDNNQKINWTGDGATTPSATLGQPLKPGEDSGLLSFIGSMYDIQVAAQAADSGKSIDVLVGVA